MQRRVSQRPAFLLLLLLLFLALFSSTAGQLTPNSTPMWQAGTNGKYRLWWTIDPVAGTISFVFNSRATGWSSLGLGSLSMTRSDTTTCWFLSSGALVCRDEWSSRHSQPALDTSQDLTALSGEFNTTNRVFAWTRKLDTGDSKDYKIVLGSPVDVIVASHTTAPTVRSLSIIFPSIFDL